MVPLFEKGTLIAELTFQVMASIVIAGWRWIDQAKVVLLLKLHKKHGTGLPFNQLPLGNRP